MKVIADSGWYAFRPSGTEEIAKIYAESFRSEGHLRQIEQEAQQAVATLLKPASLSQGPRPQDPGKPAHNKIFGAASLASE